MESDDAPWDVGSPEASRASGSDSPWRVPSLPDSEGDSAAWDTPPEADLPRRPPPAAGSDDRSLEAQLAQLALVALRGDAPRLPAGDAPRRGRGRPRGLFGSARERAFLADMRARRGGGGENAGGILQRQRPPARPAPPQTLLPEIMPPSFLQNLGGEAHRAMFTALSRKGVKSNARLNDILQQLCGPSPRSSLPLLAEAKLLKCCPAEMKEHLILAASSLYMGTRLFAGSFLSQVRHHIASGRLLPVCCVVNGAYDETPMKLTGNVDPSPRSSPDQVAFTCSATSRQPPKSDKVTSVSKIFQSSFQLVLIMRVSATGRFVVFKHPLLCPLQVGDAGTGEVIRSIMEEQTWVPLLHSAREDFPLNVDIRTIDQNRANIRAEDSYSADPRTIRSRIACEVHIVSVVQRGMYQPIHSHISGMIATSLAMRPLGAFAKFREALAHVLECSVEFIDGEAPSGSHPVVLNRERLLMLLLPKPTDIERRNSLRRNLNGDWSSSAIEVYTSSANRSADFSNQRAWSQRVASSLMRYPPPIFNRGRWLKSTSTVRAFALIANCHHLLARVVPVWLMSIQGVPPRLQGVSREFDPGAFYAGVDPWDTDGPCEEERAANPKQGASEIDWAEFNERQRVSAGKFAAMQPGPTLLVAAISLKPLVRQMNLQLAVASEPWLRQQYGRAVRDHARPLSRALEAYSCKTLSSFFACCRELLFDERPWTAIRHSDRTQSAVSQAYSMIARSMGGIAQLLMTRRLAHPFRLFGLLAEDRELVAALIQSDPECMLDPIAKAVKERFPTSELLLSEEPVLCARF